MTVTFETLPDLTAWALTEQIDDSRHPLPTPPPLAKPILYEPVAAPLAGAPLAAADAPLLGAVEAPLLEQATAINATAARPPSILARIDPFWIMGAPPLRSAGHRGRAVDRTCLRPRVRGRPCASCGL